MALFLDHFTQFFLIQVQFNFVGTFVSKLVVVVVFIRRGIHVQKLQKQSVFFCCAEFFYILSKYVVNLLQG